MKKKTYPLVCPVFIIEHINEGLDDNMTVDMFIPGIEKALHRLNKERLFYPPKSMKDDEGFATWVFNFGDDGKFYVSADQLHYVKKGAPRDYVYDGKDFVPAKKFRK